MTKYSSSSSLSSHYSYQDFSRHKQKYDYRRPAPCLTLLPNNQLRLNSIQILRWWKPVSLHSNQVYLHQLAQTFLITSRYYPLIWKSLPHWIISYSACAFIFIHNLCLPTHKSNSYWLRHCSIQKNKSDLLVLLQPKMPPRVRNGWIAPCLPWRVKTHISIAGENC